MFAFAHEAPIYVAALDSVFFASNGGGPLGMSDIDHNNQVSRINLKDVPVNLNGTVINIPVAEVRLYSVQSVMLTPATA
jgi:gluconolactonase